MGFKTPLHGNQTRRFPIADRLARLTKRGPMCWTWNGAKNTYGYGTITYQGRTHLAHRLAYAVTYGPIPDGMMVLHCCDNPACVNPAHLRVGTQFENMQDAAAKGRLRTPRIAMFGSTNPSAKLTERKVRKIRKRLSQGEDQHVVAARYGVSRSLIGQIERRQIWRGVEP